MPGLDETEPTSPMSLITVPITSPHPFVTLPTSSLPPTFLTKPNPAVPSIPSLPTHDDIGPVSPVAQLELQDFLTMGHATLCWCSQSSSPSCRSITSTSVPRSRSHSQHIDIRKKDFHKPGLTAETDGITMSPSSTSSYFVFEDLGSTGYDLLTPSGSEEGDGDALREQEEWTFVTSGNDRYNKARLFTKVAQEEPRVVSSPVSVVYPSLPRTPVHTPCSPSPVDQPLSRFKADERVMPNSQTSPRAWPAYSP
jgi:hypothetical protein